MISLKWTLYNYLLYGHISRKSTGRHKEATDIRNNQLPPPLPRGQGNPQ